MRSTFPLLAAAKTNRIEPGTSYRADAYITAMANPMRWMKGVLRSLLFLLACPLMLILTTSFVKTTSFTNTIKVGAITCLLTYGLTLLFLRWGRCRLRDVGLELTANSAPRMLFGFGIGFALVGLQEALLYAGGHI